MPFLSPNQQRQSTEGNEATAENEQLSAVADETMHQNRAVDRG